MRAILLNGFGGPEVLEAQDVPNPIPADDAVLIRVVAAGVSRADVGQRMGSYPPPAGAPAWPGLEVSGIVESIGVDVTRWRPGDEVCALLPGGGYAEKVTAPASQVLPVPVGVSLPEAAALPEAVATVWSNLVLTGGMRAGDTVLVHGGSSGIGVVAVQMARAMGCRVAVTAGSARKLAVCADLGADILIDYTREDFVERVLAETDGRGVDLVLDAIAGDYVDRDVLCLAPHGRVLLIGAQSGVPATVDVGALLGRWASIHGSTLRARPREEKDAIVASVAENVWPLVEAGQLRPLVDSTFALDDARLAHELMESSEHIGKILLLP